MTLDASSTLKHGRAIFKIPSAKSANSEIDIGFHDSPIYKINFMFDTKKDPQPIRGIKKKISSRGFLISKPQLTDQNTLITV